MDASGTRSKDDSVGARYAPDSMPLLDRRRDDGRPCGDDQQEFAERLAADRGHLSEPDDPEAYKQRNHSYDAMRAPAWRLLERRKVSCPRQTFPSFARLSRGDKRAARLPWRAWSRLGGRRPARPAAASWWTRTGIFRVRCPAAASRPRWSGRGRTRRACRATHD